MIVGMATQLATHSMDQSVTSLPLRLLSPLPLERSQVLSLRENLKELYAPHASFLDGANLVNLVSRLLITVRFTTQLALRSMGRNVISPPLRILGLPPLRSFRPLLLRENLRELYAPCTLSFGEGSLTDLVFRHRIIVGTVIQLAISFMDRSVTSSPLTG